MIRSAVCGVSRLSVGTDCSHTYRSSLGLGRVPGCTKLRNSTPPDNLLIYPPIALVDRLFVAQVLYNLCSGPRTNGL